MPAPVDRENFYGYASDFEEIKGTMFTARFEHDFSDNVSIRNTTRFGHLKQFYVLTGVNARDGAEPGPGLVDRRSHAAGQVPGEARCITNQTNLTINVATGAVKHAITTGVEFIVEEQFNPTYVGPSLGTLVPPTSTTRIATTCSPVMRPCATASSRAARPRPSAPMCSTR